ncbi:MAG: hypothetical protein IJZ68_09200 [Bacteroidaceae bacterium]|nr:hypothetical protein [Bacteroidaceae bacterium]
MNAFFHHLTQAFASVDLDWNLFWLFCVLNVFNVIIQTAKSIATIRCSKWIAALVNAVAYGLYTVVLVYMTCDLELWLKVVVVALANLIGVFVVKACEEKAKKDKLWKVEATVRANRADILKELLNENNMQYSVVPVVGAQTDEQYVVFNIYCPTSADSHVAREVLTAVQAKYFVGESQNL